MARQPCNMKAQADASDPDSCSGPVTHLHSSLLFCRQCCRRWRTHEYNRNRYSYKCQWMHSYLTEVGVFVEWIRAQHDRRANGNACDATFVNWQTIR